MSNQYSHPTRLTKLPVLAIFITITFIIFENVTAAEQLWHSFVVVKGILQQDGTVVRCQDPRARLEDNSCEILSCFTCERHTPPRKYNIQELLEMELAGKLQKNQRAVAVGPGPVTTAKYLDKDNFAIFYRLEPVLSTR